MSRTIYSITSKCVKELAPYFKFTSDCLSARFTYLACTVALACCASRRPLCSAAVTRYTRQTSVAKANWRVPVRPRPCPIAPRPLDRTPNVERTERTRPGQGATRRASCWRHMRHKRQNSTLRSTTYACSCSTLRKATHKRKSPDADIESRNKT